MISFRYVSVLPLVLVLSACVSISSSNISEKDTIKGDEGVVVLRTHGSLQHFSNVGQIAVHDRDGSGVALPLVRLSVKSGNQLLMLKVKSGARLYLTGYASYGGKARFAKDEFNFEVLPGSITYIGDIVVKENRYSVQVAVRDKEESAVAEARQSAPWLFAKYPYRKSIVRKSPG